jgi:DNA-binding IclR family transcriptional regulator
VIGRRVPPHCTALGKILLAYDYEALERILAKGSLPALTPNTITNPEVLKRELERVRSQGYAMDWEEFHEGTICVAAPVRNYRGRVVAAISVSLPKTRLTHDPLDRFVQAVTVAAHQVSQFLGHEG